MDLAHMGGLLPGDSIWVVGGINYEGQQHWYPDTFVPGYEGYTEIKVAAIPAAAPVPGTVALLGLGMLALGWSRKNRSLA